jgi:hypothetical protein
LPKKKKTDNSAEKIKKRVAVMVKERPSHKEVLEFFRDLVTEQYSAFSKIKTTSIEITDNEKEKIVKGVPLV